MPHLTSCPSSRCPRCYPCSSVLPLPEERSGSPTFTGSLLRHAVLSDPGEAARPLPFPRTAVWSSDKLTSSTLPQVSLTGLHHFSLAAYGLPHPCLRLTPAVTGSRLKTRYEMGWVGPFSVALSATSKPAPRGAQLVEEPVTRTPPHLEPIVPNSGNRLRIKPFTSLGAVNPVDALGLRPTQPMEARRPSVRKATLSSSVSCPS
jgi:hypothetical protein